MRLLAIIILTFGYSLLANGQTLSVQFYGDTFENCATNAKIDSSLFWYGVYSTDSGEYSKLVSAKVLYKKERERLYTTSNQAGINGNAIFYIGFTNKVAEKRVSFLGDEFLKSAGKDLYPGEIHWLYTYRTNPTHSLQLFGAGNVKDYDYCPIIEGYQLVLTSSNFKKEALRQEIYSSIKIENKCQIAHLKWFGDIDGDNKVDFIIVTSPAHEVKRHHIFLSSLANKDNFVGQPLDFLVGSCY